MSRLMDRMERPMDRMDRMDRSYGGERERGGGGGGAAPVQGLGSHVEERTEEVKPVDREKTCPMLLRVFCSNGRHHSNHEFARGGTPTNELQIYTWMDCTLRELTMLIKEVNPDARRRGTFFEFAIVYPDQAMSGYRSRDIGNTCSGQPGVDDAKTLGQCKFEIGDYIDVAITVPGAVPLRAGGGPGMGMGMGMGMRGPPRRF